MLYLLIILYVLGCIILPIKAYRETEELLFTLAILATCIYATPIIGYICYKL
jgi:hypothetical protein